jgi:hypothetical protein
MVTIVLSVVAIVLSLLSFYWSWQAARLMDKTERDLRELERLRQQRLNAR